MYDILFVVHANIFLVGRILPGKVTVAEGRKEEGDESAAAAVFGVSPPSNWVRAREIHMHAHKGN